MDDFRKRIDFSVRLDEMKTVKRQTKVILTGDQEDDAQHSYHISALAVLLKDYANEPVDLEKVLTMLLFHDVIELEAGDTFCYDESAQDGKEEREFAAAKNLYGSLPDSIGEELFSLWIEFEERKTPEAKFANALDRGQPIFNNYYSKGGSWVEHRVRRSQVLKRIAPVREGCVALHDTILSLVDDAVIQGWLLDE